MQFNIDKATQKAISKYPERALDLAKSFEERKVKAKTRMMIKLNYYQEIGTLPSCIQRINVIGGWYGNIIIPLIDRFLTYKEINFYEIDSTALSIAQNIYFPERFDIKWIMQNANEIKFSGNDKLTINTSCEHMAPLKIENGYVALQSNDYENVEEHFNCVNSPDELIEQYNLEKVWYADTKNYKDYNRFTVIGRK